LVLFNPANTTTVSSTAAPQPTAAANAARDVHPVFSNIKLSSLSLDTELHSLAIRETNTTTTATTLAIPQTSTPAVPGSIPVAAIGAFFQITLNAFASGMGQALQGVVSLLVTTGKASIGVNQSYTMHVSGICEGTIFNVNSTNTTNPLNITRCISYGDVGTCAFSFLFIEKSNLTSTSCVQPHLQHLGVHLRRCLKHYPPRSHKGPRPR